MTARDAPPAESAARRMERVADLVLLAASLYRRGELQDCRTALRDVVILAGQLHQELVRGR